MLLSAAGVPVTANISHSVDFALFELQFVTSKGMLTMEGGGQRWRERSVVASATFPGYREVDRGVWRDGEYRAAMLAMVANQYGFLVRSEPLACIGRDALEAQQLCAAIRASASAAHGTDRIQCSTQALTYD
jgi:predicted dehydrogenase